MILPRSGPGAPVGSFQPTPPPTLFLIGYTALYVRVGTRQTIWHKLRFVEADWRLVASCPYFSQKNHPTQHHSSLTCLSTAYRLGRISRVASPSAYPCHMLHRITENGPIGLTERGDRVITALRRRPRTKREAHEMYFGRRMESERRGRQAIKLGVHPWETYLTFAATSELSFRQVFIQLG